MFLAKVTHSFVGLDFNDTVRYLESQTELDAYVSNITQSAELLGLTLKGKVETFTLILNTISHIGASEAEMAGSWNVGEISPMLFKQNGEVVGSVSSEGSWSDAQKPLQAGVYLLPKIAHDEEE